MEHTIDIAIQDPKWGQIEALESFTNDIILRTLLAADSPSEGGTPFEVSVVYANNDLIQVLNKEYRGKNKPTNVLSFAMLDDEDHIEMEVTTLGDIVLAYETIENEAKEQRKTFMDHLAHLLIHGCLHLLGYDHIEEDDATLMETLEIRILQGLNIQNPYTQAL